MLYWGWNTWEQQIPTLNAISSWRSVEEQSKAGTIWIQCILFKVAPYSFTITRALRMEAQISNLRALEGKRQRFWDILLRQHKHKKQNWQWIFLRFLPWNSVKFGRLVVHISLWNSRSSFLREIYKTSFFAAVKDK